MKNGYDESYAVIYKSNGAGQAIENLDSWAVKRQLAWNTAKSAHGPQTGRVDRVIDVGQEAVEDTTRTMAAVEGIFAGVPSGGAVATALELS